MAASRTASPGADSNFDGSTDILWRHDVSGPNAVWYMDGVTRINATFTSPSTLADLNGQIVGPR